MSRELFDKKLAVLGAGKLGGILLRAYLKQGLFDVSRTTATVKHAERAAALAKQLSGVSVITDNREAVRGADIILLTVKPQTVAEVLQQIAPEVGAETLLVSVAASVPTSYLEQQLAAAPASSRLRENSSRNPRSIISNRFTRSTCTFPLVPCHATRAITATTNPPPTTPIKTYNSGLILRH